VPAVPSQSESRLEFIHSFISYSPLHTIYHSNHGHPPIGAPDFTLLVGASSAEGAFPVAARSAAKIHGFLLFSGGGRCPLGKLNFGAPHWILGGWVVLQNLSVIIITPPWQTNRAQPAGASYRQTACSRSRRQRPAQQLPCCPGLRRRRRPGCKWPPLEAAAAQRAAAARASSGATRRWHGRIYTM
jgi:hypothetical protein